MSSSKTETGNETTTAWKLFSSETGLEKRPFLLESTPPHPSTSKANGGLNNNLIPQSSKGKVGGNQRFTYKNPNCVKPKPTEGEKRQPKPLTLNKVKGGLLNS